MNYNDIYVVCELSDEENSDPIFLEFTVEDILNEYYPYWLGKIKENRPEYLSDSEEENKKLCLDEWVLINWAIKKNENN